MKRITFLIMFCLIIVCISNINLGAEIQDVSKLAVSLSRDYESKKGKVLIKKRIAILDFENLSESLKKYNVGTSISLILSGEMAHSTIFRLVERERVDKLINEVELGMTGAIDPDTAVKAGKISRADIAHFILGQLASPNYLRQTPLLTY